MNVNDELLEALGTLVKPIVRQAVIEALDELEQRGLVGDHAHQLAYDEATASRMLGLTRDALKAQRLLGRVDHAKCGRQIRYRRQDLIRYLEENEVATNGHH